MSQRDPSVGTWWGLPRSGTPMQRELRGLPLRYVLVTLLMEAQRPLTITELIAGCRQEGVYIDGRPSKVISDSLRWERRRGRVIRVGRGVYRYGRAPRSTKSWILARVRAIRERLAWPLDVGPCESSRAHLAWTDALAATPPSRPILGPLRGST